MKFTYRVDTYEKSITEIALAPDALASVLGKAGKRGWELIEMKELPGDRGFVLVY
jgi:hypothetical protein